MDDYYGEEFLNKKNPNWHMSEEIMHSAEKSDSPKEKIRRYLDRIEQLTRKTMDESRTTHENDRTLLRRLYYNRYVIKKENIPESYFEFQEKIAQERGEGYLRYDEATKELEKEQIISEQKHSLDKWLDYFESKDTASYPMWFKYYAFQGMVKLGGYDKQNEKYSKRTETTLKPFVELDREALAIVYDEMTRFLNKEEILDEELKAMLKGGNFGKLYSAAIKKIDSISKDDTKSDEGIWKKYEQGSDPNILFNDIYGKGTGWCTAGSIDVATSHVNGGDFYVYYTKDRKGNFTCPRIAIRKEDGKIAEIRGIEAAQNIEANMETVVSKKLEEPEFPDRDEYKRKVEDMQMMTYIHTKWKMSGKLDERDLKFLYEIEHPIVGFGHGKDPRIQEILDTRNKKTDFVETLGLKPNEISTNSITALKSGIRVHIGNLELPRRLTNCVIPNIINGEIDFYNVRTMENVSFLQETYNNGDFRLVDLEKIENVVFPDGIKSIRLALSKENGKIGKNIQFPEKLNSLEISGITSLKKTDIKIPQSLERLIITDLKEMDGVEIPATLKNLSLPSIDSLSGVNFPSNLASLCIDGVRNLDGIELPTTLKELRMNSVEGLSGIKLPPNLEALSLKSLRTIDGIELPTTLKELRMNSVESLSGVKLPPNLEMLGLASLKNIDGIELPSTLKSLSLPSVENLSGINLPPNLDTLCLDSVKNADEIGLPQNLKVLSMRSLMKIDRLELPEKMRTVDLRSLVEVEELIFQEGIGEIILSESIDVTCIRVPEEQKCREKMIRAIEMGYRNSGIGDSKTKKIIKKLEDHFEQVSKNNTVSSNKLIEAPMVATQTNKPKKVNVSSSIFSTIKEKSSELFKQAATTTKEKMQKLKEILMDEKRNTEINNTVNNINIDQVSEEVTSRKK